MSSSPPESSVTTGDQGDAGRTEPAAPRAAGMSPRDVLRELEALAARLGVVVRVEPFDPRVLEGRGGLCWLRGRPTVLLDASLPPLDRVAVLAEALAVFDVEALYVPPAIRQRLRVAG